MIVGKFSITFNRGKSRSTGQDLGLPSTPVTTIDGKEVVGVGTHWKDQETKMRVLAWEEEERQIRAAIKTRFMRSPLEGVYILPKKGAGRELLASMSITPGIRATVAEYDLNPQGSLPPEDVAEWINAIREQLDKAPTGKAPQASNKGLTVLENLANCPILAESTRNELLGMIAEAKLGSVNRIELKRRISVLDLRLDGTDIPSVIQPVEAPIPSTEPVEPGSSPLASNPQEPVWVPLQPRRGFNPSEMSPEESNA